MRRQATEHIFGVDSSGHVDVESFSANVDIGNIKEHFSKKLYEAR